MPLKIDLKPGEKFVLNGAVVSVGRDGRSLLLQNEAVLLREKDIMQEEDATTPARRIYFTIMLMYIDPAEPRRPTPAQYQKLIQGFATAAANAPDLQRELIPLIQNVAAATITMRFANAGNSSTSKTGCCRPNPHPDPSVRDQALHDVAVHFDQVGEIRPLVENLDRLAIDEEGQADQLGLQVFRQLVVLADEIEAEGRPYLAVPLQGFGAALDAAGGLARLDQLGRDLAEQAVFDGPRVLGNVLGLVVGGICLHGFLPFRLQSESIPNFPLSRFRKHESRSLFSLAQPVWICSRADSIWSAVLITFELAEYAC